jgi:hypothetical protein
MPNAGTVDDLIKQIDQLRDDLLNAITAAKINPNQIQIVSLSNISSNAGNIFSGELRFGNGKAPGQGFSGVRIGYPSFTYNGSQWNLATVSNDILAVGFNTDGTITAVKGTIGGWSLGTSVLQSPANSPTIILNSSYPSISIGTTPPTGPNSGSGIWIDATGINGLQTSNLQFRLSAIDGTGIFAGGAGVINSSGIIMNGLFYPVQFNATNAGNIRTGSFGMILPVGSTTPAMQWNFQSPAGANLITNGNATNGNTGWTDASGIWSSITTNPYTGFTNSFWHNPTIDGCPGLNIQNLPGLTAGTTYAFSFASVLNSGILKASLNIVWKTSGGAVVRTDVINGSSSISWLLTSSNLTAPATATNADIQMNAGDTFNDAQFTDISVSSIGTIVQLTTTDTNLQFQNAALSSPVVISNYQGARVYNSIAESIPNNATTQLTFDSEHWNTDNNHSTITNTSRLTCQTAGIYIVVAQAAFAANVTGTRIIYINKNGDYVNPWCTFNSNYALQNTGFSMELVTILQLNVGDYVEASVYQNSGASLNINTATNASPEFMMQKIG